MDSDPPDATQLPTPFAGSKQPGRDLSVVPEHVLDSSALRSPPISTPEDSLIAAVRSADTTPDVIRSAAPTSRPDASGQTLDPMEFLAVDTSPG